MEAALAALEYCMPAQARLCNIPLSTPGYPGYRPGMVLGTRKCRITPRWDHVLTVAVIYPRPQYCCYLCSARLLRSGVAPTRCPGLTAHARASWSGWDRNCEYWYEMIQVSGIRAMPQTCVSSYELVPVFAVFADRKPLRAHTELCRLACRHTASGGAPSASSSLRARRAPNARAWQTRRSARAPARRVLSARRARQPGTLARRWAFRIP